MTSSPEVHPAVEDTRLAVWVEEDDAFPKGELMGPGYLFNIVMYSNKAGDRYPIYSGAGQILGASVFIDNGRRLAIRTFDGMSSAEQWWVLARSGEYSALPIPARVYQVWGTVDGYAFVASSGEPGVTPELRYHRFTVGHFWAGEYGEDPNQAITHATDLNVFADFRPVLPASHCKLPYVFLANIDPELQLEVLDQMESPKFVAADTMNFWITGKKEQLLKVLGRVTLALMNDAEARMLTGRKLLIDAAEDILALGPRYVLVKKGEHGALLFSKDSLFAAPSFPIRKLVDPTGAGDSFAGALVGYLASTDDVSEPNIRMAIIYGTTVASFDVEDFSLRRLAALTREQIEERFGVLRSITAF